MSAPGRARPPETARNDSLVFSREDSIGRLLRAQALALAPVQVRQDLEWARRAARLEESAGALRRLPPALAREVVASALSGIAVAEMEVTSHFQFSRSKEREFSLGIQLLNLGFSTRHSQTLGAVQRLTVRVQRAPLPPSPPPNGKEN